MFKSGDLVVLKSGGPVMTVNSNDRARNALFCQWFAGKKLEGGYFKETSLEKYENDGKK